MPKRKSENTTRIFNVIICEDIRTEINNKYSLMGVFSGDFHVPEFPAMGVKIAVFVEVHLESLEAQTFSVRIKYDGQERMTLEGQVKFSNAGTAGIATPQIMIAMEREGDLEVEVYFEDGPRSTVKRHVSKGPVIGGTVSSSVGSPPAR